MGVDDHGDAPPGMCSDHLTEELFIQIRIHADRPTSDPASCDSFSHVASSSSIVLVMSGADGVLTSVM